MESPSASEQPAHQHDGARGGAGLAGVVLCGGRSTRMGVDKATISFEGATLLERALACLDEVCDPVLIAAGSRALTVPDRHVVADPVSGAGPLSGVVAGLRASPHRLLAVVAVDLPWIDPCLLRLLAARIGDSDVAVCVTRRGVEPLHAVYSTSFLATAETALAASERSLQRLIGRTRAVRLPETEWRGAGVSDRFARNINTPEDLAEISRQRPR